MKVELSYPYSPGHKDVDTSIEAAESMKDKAESIRNKVLNVISNKGIFEVHTGNVRMQFIGEKALSKFINAHIRLLPGTRHVQTNHITTVDKLRAKNHCTLVGFLSRPEKIYTFIAGSYETDLEKVAGEWKITHRIVHVDNGASFVEGDIAEQTQSFMEWMATNSVVMQGE